jgi:hypothetical protein
LARAQQICSAVGGDSIEPRAKGRSPIKPVQLAAGLQKCLLDQIFGVVFVLSHSINQSVNGAAVSFHEHAKSLRVAGTSLGNGAFVGGGPTLGRIHYLEEQVRCQLRLNSGFPVSGKFVMQKYDVSLKLLLRSSGASALQALTGGVAVERWLDVEMPEVRNTRVDLLGETSAGGLLHIELQSTNDSAMPLRMAEYCLRVYRLFNRFPRQILLYVGDAPLQMETELNGPGLKFSYESSDIRNLDGERLLESDHIGDNVMAILTRLRDRKRAVQRIPGTIAGGENDAGIQPHYG